MVSLAHALHGGGVCRRCVPYSSLSGEMTEGRCQMRYLLVAASPTGSQSSSAKLTASPQLN